jgi:hypothetical protein
VAPTPPQEDGNAGALGLRPRACGRAARRAEVQLRSKSTSGRMLCAVTVTRHLRSGRAAGLSIVIAIIGRIVTPRGRVKWAVTHQYTFLTRANPPQPPPTQQPAPPATGTQVVPAATAQLAQPLLVFTRTIWVQNVGRAAVDDVEIIFSNRPHHFEVWPQRLYREDNNPAGNLAIRLNGLNPREWVTITMLNVAVQLPLVTNVRWKGGVATEAPMAPQQVFPRLVRLLVAGLMLSGIAFWLYLIVRLILSGIG